MKISNLKQKIQSSLLTIGVLALLTLIVHSALLFSEWKRTYRLELQNFILITPRDKPLAHLPVVKEAEAKAPEAMTTEEYIAYVFGHDARMALAISQAENGTRACDRTNWNTNRTTDYGVFMINSVHLNKGWKLADLIDCHRNIDYAYQIYQAQGWTPWVVYNTGAYKQYLK